MDKKDMPRRREAMELRVRRTMAALEKNNMSAYFAQTSEEAVRLVEGLLCAGDTISCGGSVTLDASGVKALMRSGRYNFLDREAVETDAERQAIYRQTFSADAFLTSSNAITERGELFHIDGGPGTYYAAYDGVIQAFDAEKTRLYDYTGRLVHQGSAQANYTRGPKKVIVVAGWNKIVRDLNAAKLYVKAVTVPANALRLHIDTPCTHAACPGTDGDLCGGCSSENRLCAQYTVMARQRVRGRVHVILVGEELGY